MSSWQVPPRLLRPDEPRRETAASLRSFIPWLRRELLFDQVHDSISPAAAALLKRPPLPTSWIDSTLTDEIFQAVLALRGDEAVSQMSLTAMRESLGFLVQPLLAMFIKLFGATPASVLAQMPTMTALFIKGVAYDWSPTSAESGELIIAYEKPIPSGVFHGWRGITLFAFDLCKTTGTNRIEVSPDSSAARYTIAWKMPERT
jgi:hypothetical protein